MADRRTKGSGADPQGTKRKVEAGRAKVEIDKVLDRDLSDQLNLSDTHEARVELLLTQIAKNTAAP